MCGISLGKMMNQKTRLDLQSKIRLYHFTNSDIGEVSTLDPKETVKLRNQFSRNDYKISDVPRTFFYVDVKSPEREVGSRRYLYYAVVDPRKILNLSDSYKMFRDNSSQLQEEDELVFDVISSSMRGVTLDIDTLLKNASKKFDGVSYITSGLYIVNMFIPVKVNRIEKNS